MESPYSPTFNLGLSLHLDYCLDQSLFMIISIWIGAATPLPWLFLTLGLLVDESLF